MTKKPSRPKRFAALSILATWLIAGMNGAQAGEIGHYGPGLLNIRDFAMPPPGIYTSIYNYYYSTDRVNDRNGDQLTSVTIGPAPGLTLGIDVDVDVYVVAPTFIWVSPWTFLGARYGALITPTFANSSVGAALTTATDRGVSEQVSTFGLGDLFVQPLWLDWSLPNADLAFSYGFYAPIGQYEIETVDLGVLGPVDFEASDNIGLGFWTHQLQGAVTWYPTEHHATAVSAALTYEMHQNKEGFDFKPGSNLSLNWGISQFIPLTESHEVLLEVGAAGYSQWQTSDDTGADARNPEVHDQVHAIGFQLGLTVIPWNAAVNFHYFHELSAIDRFQGDVLGLNLAMKW